MQVVARNGSMRLVHSQAREGESIRSRRLSTASLLGYSTFRASARPAASVGQVRTMLRDSHGLDKAALDKVWIKPEVFDESHWAVIPALGELYRQVEDLRGLQKALTLPRTRLNRLFLDLLQQKIHFCERLLEMGEFFVGTAYWGEHDDGCFMREVEESRWINDDEGELLRLAAAFAIQSAKTLFLLRNSPQTLRMADTWEGAVQELKNVLDQEVHNLNTRRSEWTRHLKRKPYYLEEAIATYVRLVAREMPDALEALQVQLRSFEQFTKANREHRVRPTAQQTEAHFKNAFHALAVIIFECQCIVNYLKIPEPAV